MARVKTNLTKKEWEKQIANKISSPSKNNKRKKTVNFEGAKTFHTEQLFENKKLAKAIDVECASRLKVNTKELENTQTMEIIKEEEKKESPFFPPFFKNIALASFILIGAIALGSLLYRPIVTVAETSKGDCKYGEWSEERIPFCLVSPEGKYFSNDRVVYEYEQNTGMCIKKTRSKSCS